MKLILYNGQKNISGQLIKKYRKQKKMTQLQLAKAVSAKGVYMDRITVTKIETGGRVCFDFELMAMAEVFGVDASALMKWEES